MEPLCQGLGYNETFTPENMQGMYTDAVKEYIGDYKNDKCGELRRKFVCTELFLPCKDSKGQFLCRDKCNKFFDTCSSSPFPYDKSMCIDFPDGNSSSGICPQTHWPRSGHWPAPPPAAPTTEAAGIPATESSTTIGGMISNANMCSA